MKFKACLGLLEETEIRARAHQCGQHFNGTNLSRKGGHRRKFSPEIDECGLISSSIFTEI